VDVFENTETWNLSWGHTYWWLDLCDWLKRTRAGVGKKSCVCLWSVSLISSCSWRHSAPSKYGQQKDPGSIGIYLAARIYCEKILSLKSEYVHKKSRGFFFFFWLKYTQFSSSGVCICSQWGARGLKAWGLIPFQGSLSQATSSSHPIIVWNTVCFGWKGSLCFCLWQLVSALALGWRSPH
jgi:hypothetical protein